MVDEDIREGDFEGLVGRRAEREAVKAQIAALRARWPRHSVPPALWQELEALEQRLEELNAE